MGATTSAQRDGKSQKDATTSEEQNVEPNEIDHGENIDAKLLQKNGQISGLNGTSDDKTGGYDGRSGEKILAEVGQMDSVLVSQKDDILEVEVLQDEAIPTLNTETVESPSANSVTPTEEKTPEEEPEFFSNLRKRTSFRKPAEEAVVKEKFTEEELTERKAESPIEEEEKATEETPSTLQEGQITSPEEVKVEPSTEETLTTEGEQNEGETELKTDASYTAPEDNQSSLPAVTANDTNAAEEEVEDTVKRQTSPDEVLPVLTTEADLLSSQEKVKVQGSPLKKLFSGAGLKKRSKKQKGRREGEIKLTESGEHAAEQLQSSNELPESQRGESSFSSPEESGEHIISEPPEAEADKVTSDEERKKDGIQPWSSFKKLMTPKKRAKRSSESEDEVIEKPKSATLSSTDSAVFTEQQEEPKPGEEEQKIELSTEEPSKKKESSMSWEALLCGSAKKRTRKTSDSDEEIAEEDEETGRAVESPLESSQDGDHELLTSSPDQAGSPSEGDGGSTWASLKRLVTPRRRAKGEDRTEDSAGFSEQVPSDSEIPKEETSFSLKRLIPGRRKKKTDGKQEQVSSDEAGKDVGSGEEDSDTPAVIPLSEFDLEEPEISVTLKEEVAEKQMDIPETEEVEPELSVPESEVTVPPEALPTTGEQTGTEEQLSWIPTTAEVETDDKTESLTKHQQLSDIPEEGVIEDTTATPKSTAEEVCQDDTIAEDIVELTSDAVTALEQAPEESLAEESTEMVSAVSRLTESPGTSGDTTPVAAEYEVKQTETVLQEAVDTIILAADVLSATKAVEGALVAHEMSGAIAVSVGLDSQEIPPMEENLVKTSVEAIPEVSDSVAAEIVSEAKTKFEAAGIAQDEVHEAHIEIVKTEFEEKVDEEIPQEDEVESEQVNEVEKELPVENVQDEASQDMQMIDDIQGTQETESVSEIQELTAVHIAAEVDQGQAEVLEEQVVSEDKPSTETEGPMEPVIEEPVYSQFAEVIEEPIMEGGKEEELEAIEMSKANSENVLMPEVGQSFTEEFAVSMSEPPTDQTSIGLEAPVNVEVAAVQLNIAAEAIDIVNPPAESIQSEIAEITNEAIIERVPSVQFTEDHEVQVQVEDSELQSAELTVEPEFQAVMTDTCAVKEDVCESAGEDQNVMITEQVTETTLVEEQNSVRRCSVQEMIRNLEMLKNSVERLPEEAKVSEIAETHKLEEMDTAIPEDSVPESDLTDEPQIATVPEAVSSIGDEAEKTPEDTTTLGMPLYADTQVEGQAEDGPTLSVEAEIEDSKDKSSDVEVLKGAEMEAVAEVPVRMDDQITESPPTEAKESPEIAAEHHEDAALEAQCNTNPESDTAMQEMEAQFQVKPDEEDDKETVEEVSQVEERGEAGEPEMQTEAVVDDQKQIDIEGCPQAERENLNRPQ
ncbi:hypothetical protein AGOR_G00110140 [Albula goreensis]|uniref:A kinase-anchoring proteins AKAP-5 and AKAP-12 calmodulin (CaM)-binding domain-containing protein n=1 Tax=Albula goreensis TaxID=1534307 RepID=A0A8T3DNE8_9TELE|nr:hypothetical protein AGOR_G00110140 [Albula goreensis]